MATIEEEKWEVASGFVFGAIVCMDNMREVILPPLFLTVSQGSQHLKYGAVQPLSWVTLGMVGRRSRMADPRESLQPLKQFVFEFTTLVVV